MSLVYPLAHAAGVSRSMIAQLEQGLRHPSIRLLSRLAQVLRLGETDAHRLYVLFSPPRRGSRRLIG